MEGQIQEGQGVARQEVIRVTGLRKSFGAPEAACDLPFASVDPEVSAMAFQLNLGTDRPRLIEMRAKK